MDSTTGVDLMSTNHIEVEIDQQDYGFATEQMVTGTYLLCFALRYPYHNSVIFSSNCMI